MDEERKGQNGTASRRRFLRAVASGGMAASALSQSAIAATPAAPPAPPAIAPGALGAASAGPGRLKIAMLVHPRMVMQDLIGPLTVFNFLNCETHLVWKDLQPVMTEVGIAIAPSTTFADCPRDLDVLFAPGGLPGTIAMMDDPVVLSFFADRGQRAKYVTADCTGSLLLGAAGLLRGYKATSRSWMALGAVSGVPALKGGAGAYSIMSWADSAASCPRRMAASVRPKSMPAVTPPPVMRLRSCTTRSCTGVAPIRASWSRTVQWLVAL